MQNESSRSNPSGEPIIPAQPQNPNGTDTPAPEAYNVSHAYNYSQNPMPYPYVVPVTEASRQRDARKKLVREGGSSVSSILLIIVTLAYGILFSRLVLRGGMGIGASIMMLGGVAVFTPFVLKRGQKLHAAGLIMLVPLIIFALSFALNAGSVNFFVFLASWGVIMLQSTLLTRSTEGSLLSPQSIGDALYKHLCLPVADMFTAIGSLFASKKSGNKNGVGWRVAVGLLIAAPVVLILLGTFSCADAAFANAVDGFMESFFQSLDEAFGDIAIAFFAAFYLIPLVLTLRSGYVRPSKPSGEHRFVDSVIAATVVFASAAVYVLFVVFQFNYFFSLSTSTMAGLPKGMTWSEYARSGFFELSGIVCATFIFAALLVAFCKKKAGSATLPLSLKLALSIVIVCDVILVASAVFRMSLYVEWCGLTTTRLFVLVAIGVIALSLLVLLAKLWFDKVPSVKCIAALALVALLGYSAVGVDRVTAEYNVERHLTRGTSIDMAYMGELSVAAAPSVERLINESPDPLVKAAAQGLVYIYYNGCDDFYFYLDLGFEPIRTTPFGALTLDHQRAQEVYSRVKPARLRERDYINYAQYQRESTMYTRHNDDEFMSYNEYVNVYGR